MKKIILSLLCAGLTWPGLAQTGPVAEAAQLETRGQFQQAATLLRTAIANKESPSDQLQKLEFELDRLKRIEEDFSFTRKDLYRAMRESLKDVKQSEIDDWIADGWFQRRMIDGKEFFFFEAVSNFYFRHPEFNVRRIFPEDSQAKEKLKLETVNTIEQFALAEKTPYVLPKTLDVTMTVTVKSNVGPDGEIIKAWLPIPRRYPFQDDFKLISSTARPAAIDKPDSPSRSIYFEQQAREDKDTVFRMEYEYTIHGVYFNLQPEKIVPLNSHDTVLQKYMEEAPHVVFTPEIKEMSAKIVGDEANPMLRAKKIYDYLCGHLLYSYSLEYSTIRNISDSCRANGYGDCGQQALLFITLCRYNGVPARWQSGWDLFPHSSSIHDWSEIYLEPYGWVPVDPYMGNYAMRYTTTLTPEEKLKVRDFYFGGLDQYRMIANDDHDQPLDPPKKALRSDDVDFQRAELEHTGKNIYFDHFSYKLSYKILPATVTP